MNNVGVFREGEIDGKPFRIFNFLSETYNPSSSEAAIDFICPSFHFKAQSLKQKEEDPNLPLDGHNRLFDERRGDEQFKFLIGSDNYEHTCELPLSPLFWCNNKKPVYGEFSCGQCQQSMLGTGYYLCVDKCGKKFHKECIECPLELKHPSFPFLSLKLYKFPFTMSCFSCQQTIYHKLYYSPTYKLILDPVCAMKPIPIFIDYLKRHLHPLTFFPKQNSLACDVCGLIKELIPTYVCARCVFVVHEDCVYFPNVIRISRHHHRIAFTYSLPSRNLSCGVCRRKVDNNYGAYSCNKCDEYFVHTRCALRKDLWDGKELEGIPEEPEIVIEPPFKRISDGIILHFSHGHHLKLDISRVYDEGKVCQACILPIYEGNYYACMDLCDFILHEACSSAPRKTQHALHAHSLKLKVDTYENADDNGFFVCVACKRNTCGFVYEYPMGFHFGFKLDLRCASVSEPFKYEGHKHPLFLALTPEEEESSICQICQEPGDEDNYCKKLTCIECSYIICFRCATLPYKARYQHDKHFLTFREKEKANGNHPGWCDICEGELVYSRKGGFYSCDDYCSATLHVDCLLGGENMYMKPGHTIHFDGKIDILRNNNMSRPFCHGSKHRCLDKLVFKRGEMTFCSLPCSYSFKG